jgi:hypothetical protein
MRLYACLAILFTAVPAAVVAQTAATAPAWELSVSAYTYFVPEDGSFAQPTLTVDRDRLHLEARYNYEAPDTGSAWIGYNFDGGDTVSWEVTPMLGVVLGATDGIAPGYKGSLGWKKLELYTEGEYVIDAGDSADSFFYLWSELTFAPIESMRFGIVTQRTRLYQTSREIQRGLLAGGSFKSLDIAGYVFNPDDEEPTFVLAIAVTF